MAGPADAERRAVPGGPDPVRRRLILSAAAAPCGLAGCATGLEWADPAPVAALPAVASPQVRVGDRWFYETINRYNRSDVIWYSPQVNRWVKREWSGDYVSSGLTGAPAGVRGREDWVLWQLVECRPAAG
jgi:hypothetical protein